MANLMALKQQKEYAETGLGSSRQTTLRERLVMQQADLTQRLSDVEAAIAALDKNPNFEEVLNVVGKVGY